MRSYKRLKARGFTLVELMIVVAIIGVLAALAIFGVRKYLASAKSAEARNTLGALNRSAVAAYERESMASELLAGGSLGTAASHRLCTGAAARVPTAVPAGKKYQPVTTPTGDFNAGDSTTGWKCLRFGMSEAIYYSYGYAANGTGTLATPAGPYSVNDTTHWQVSALGDLNGDANNSTFASGGEVRTGGNPVVGTTLFEDNPDE